MSENSRQVQLSPLVFVTSGSNNAETADTTSDDANRANAKLYLQQISSQTDSRPAVFGDGSHPTTRLCAGAVDFLCRTRPGISVLDVGTGTGVLARIARARGSKKVCATEIDPRAIEEARLNCAFDCDAVKAEEENKIEIESRLPNHWGPVFDLVVANILESPLKQLSSQIRDALRPQGTVLLSGFTPIQSPAIRTHYENLSFIFESESTMKHVDGSIWSMVMLRC